MPTPSALPALPALPGSSPVAGSGPAEPGVLDGLLDGGAALAGVPIGAALAAHRELGAGPWRDLLGPLLVPARDAERLQAALATGDLGLPVLLVADSAGGTRDPLESLRAARSVLLDDDRVELIGARLPLPPIADPTLAARALLAALDLSVPAWVQVRPGPGAAAVLEELAADGAENLCLDLTGNGSTGSDPIGRGDPTGIDPTGRGYGLARLLRRRSTWT